MGEIVQFAGVMMNDDYVKSMVEKLGPILEFGGAVRNFLRVRVDFPLEKALKANFKIRIEDKTSVSQSSMRTFPITALFVLSLVMMRIGARRWTLWRRVSDMGPNFERHR